MSSSASSAARNLLRRYIEIGQRPGDDADLRVRKRTAVIVGIAVALASIFYFALGLAVGRPEMSVVAGAQITLLAIGEWWFARTGRTEPFVVVMLVVGLLTIGTGIVSLGGLLQGNGNTIWSVLVPIGAVLFFGRRAGPLALAAVVLVVLVGAVADPVLRTRTSPLPPELGVPLYAMNLLGTTAVALGLVAFIDGERVRARAQSEALLHNVLPEAIIQRLNAGERVIADHCPEVTVLFSDVVDFTPFSERAAPATVVAALNDLFSAFDELAERYRLEKIKTIGDAYMVVAGVPEQRPDHATVMLEMALAMHAAADAQPPIGDHRLQMRTGIATGPVVAGIIGRQKFSYDLWGDTVNTASRMESSGVPGCIQVTAATWERVRDRYPWEVREDVEVKGKGAMRTYLLNPGKLPS
ncbi:MAG TPA: adenylate/guanylate cyclase domain-containing protein [Candidatus Limnocylindria bacterium]